MLSVWFWLERWFTDTPNLATILFRGMATGFIGALALIALGIAFDLSGDIVAPMLLALQFGLICWMGWAINRRRAAR
ncbi:MULTISPECIES: hypothetical protein [Methylobacterium]|uniref:hypothetical protein n=1 Tax=Methylobacterium TaxID=407 RepID=UPI0011C83064|nr:MULTISPECIES: hypothetical protein [Methylobacterium]MBD8902316.1 hypothetical protein [Methylobacterium bullatum]TXN25759.1 hypothetical protein FV220_17550 [Methylobacterium sp. WL19]